MCDAAEQVLRRFPTLCALKASLTCSALLLDCLGESLGAALSALQHRPVSREDNPHEKREHGPAIRS